MLKLTNVSKTFNKGTVNEKTALNHLNLEVKDALEITVQDDCIILKKAENADIFTGGTENLVEYEGKKVSKASILALAKLAGLKLAE